MLTVAYMGGGGYQKLLKTCLRNLWTTPKSNVKNKTNIKGKSEKF